MEIDFKSFKEALFDASNLTTKSKRFSPSKISPAVCPAKLVLIA